MSCYMCVYLPVARKEMMGLCSSCCMKIFMYAHTHTHTHTRTRIYTHIHTQPYTHARAGTLDRGAGYYWVRNALLPLLDLNG